MKSRKVAHCKLENVMSKYFMLYVSLVLEHILIEETRELKSKMNSEGRLDVQEITWSLDAKQNPNHCFDNSQGKRKNFPTISVCIPHKGQLKDANSEVCVNQWVYMYTVLQMPVN